MNNGKIHFGIHGAFRVVDHNGVNLTPNSDRGKAMLGRLAAETGFAHSRNYLANLLWDSAHHANPRGSLRTALSEIRRSFGPHSDVIQASRNTIALDPSRIAVSDGLPAQLLEGLDLRNEEQWEDWLREAHQETPACTATAIRPGLLHAYDTQLAVSIGQGADQGGQFLARLVADAAVRRFTDRTGCRAALSEADSPAAPLLLQVDASNGFGSWHVTMSLHDKASGAYVWSNYAKLSNKNRSPLHDTALQALLNGALTAICSWSLENDHGSRIGRLTRAAQAMFSFDHHQLAEARTLLDGLARDDPSGIVPAWQIYLAMICLIERSEASSKYYSDYVLGMVQSALAADPGNAFVNSAVSSAYLKVLDRPDEALAFARRAVRLSHGEPFASDALGAAMLFWRRKRTRLCLPQTRPRSVRRYAAGPFL